MHHVFFRPALRRVLPNISHGEWTVHPALHRLYFRYSKMEYKKKLIFEYEIIFIFPKSNFEREYYKIKAEYTFTNIYINIIIIYVYYIISIDHIVRLM